MATKTAKKSASGKKLGPSPEGALEGARKRAQYRAVKLYLNALESRPTKQIDPDKIHAAIVQVDEELADAVGIAKVKLIQQKLDLQAELAAGSSDPSIDMDQLETDFIEHAWEWASREGITRKAFRSLGVPPRVLDAAQIPASW